MTEPDRKTTEIHIRSVPKEIWLKLRQSALADGVSLRTHVLDILSQAVQERILKEQEASEALKKELLAAKLTEIIL